MTTKIPMRTKLSPNFSLGELCFSETAQRCSIDNSPPPEAAENLGWLVRDILQPVRTSIGKPMVVRSGYRCPTVNKRIGSSNRSAHVYGLAADIEVPGVSNLKLAQHIRKLLRERGIAWDQIIAEFCDRNDPAAGWVHVAIAQPRTKAQRRQCISAHRVRQGGRRKTVYVPGFKTQPLDQAA